MSTAVDMARGIALDQDLASRLGLDLRKHSHYLVGPCPKCGGTDRFTIKIGKYFHCRGCDAKGGDSIALLRWLEGVGFTAAVNWLTGSEIKPAAPPRKP